MALYAFAFSGYFTTSLFGMVLAGAVVRPQGTPGRAHHRHRRLRRGAPRRRDRAGQRVFILGRAVQGLGGGLVIVALYVVVGRAYPERLRPAIMAAFAAGWVVPSIVGPLASGAVTEHLGWRWVFLGIPVLVALPLALALPRIRRRASGPVDEAAGAEPLRPAADPARARHLPRRRTPPVRRPGPAPAVPAPGTGRGGPPSSPAVLGLLPARHLPGRPRPALRRAAARPGRRFLHRRRVLRAADAGHPARGCRRPSPGSRWRPAA
ncbi:MFS transporter [Streptomyces tricolor]|nr:MFS transporter [Streptomyces tricolor]